MSMQKQKHIQYKNQYNKKTQHKQFEQNGKVIVLYSKSINKLISRWHDPCSISLQRSK